MIIIAIATLSCGSYDFSQNRLSCQAKKTEGQATSYTSNNTKAQLLGVTEEHPITDDLVLHTFEKALYLSTKGDQVGDSDKMLMDDVVSYGIYNGWLFILQENNMLSQIRVQDLITKDFIIITDFEQVDTNITELLAFQDFVVVSKGDRQFLPGDALPQRLSQYNGECTAPQYEYSDRSGCTDCKGQNDFLGTTSPVQNVWYCLKQCYTSSHMEYGYLVCADQYFVPIVCEYPYIQNTPKTECIFRCNPPEIPFYKDTKCTMCDYGYQDNNPPSYIIGYINKDWDQCLRSCSAWASGQIDPTNYPLVFNFGCYYNVPKFSCGAPNILNDAENACTTCTGEQEYYRYDGYKCATSCNGEYVLSRNSAGLPIKICNDFMRCNKKITLEGIATALTCTEATGKKQLGSSLIYVSSCKSYYFDNCQQPTSQSQQKLCQLPLEQEGQCIFGMKTENVVLGDSDNWYGCINGQVLQDYVCKRTCPESSGFLNWYGTNCVLTCAATEKISASVGGEQAIVCSSGLDCPERYVINSFNQLQCAPANCENGKMLKTKFCINSCKDYFKNNCVGTTTALGRADLGCDAPIEEDGVCNAAIWSDVQLGDSDNWYGCTNGYLKDYVCGSCGADSYYLNWKGTNCLSKCNDQSTPLAEGQFRICADYLNCQWGMVDNVNKKLVCTQCVSQNERKLGRALCVENCLNHFNTNCKGVFGANNNCNAMLEQQGKCMASTKGIDQGSSGGYFGCVDEYYAMDYLCIPCDQPDQYIDNLGQHCLKSCTEGQYIFYSSKLKVCRKPASTPACGALQALDVIQTSMQLSLQCGTCRINPEITVDFGYVMNGFCIRRTCKAYTDDQACIDKNKGNCANQYAQTSGNTISCVATCQADWLYSSNADKCCGIPKTTTQISSLNQETLEVKLIECTKRTVGNFCIEKCNKYFAQSNGCNSQLSSDGNCNGGYVASDGKRCLEYCDADSTKNKIAFIFQDSEMVCMEICQGYQYSQINTLTLEMTCSDCLVPNKRLGKFCVSDCWGYFSTQCGSIMQQDQTGNCNRPLDENGICFIPSTTTVYGGTSNKYGTCVTGKYLKNHVCVVCDGTDEYVDAQGINCVQQADCTTTNFVKDFIYASNGIKICKTTTEPACGTETPYLLLAEVTLQQAKRIQLKCTDCKQKLLVGSFCLEATSCRAYFEQLNGCKHSMSADGNCDKQYVSSSIFKGITIQTCAKFCANGAEFLFSDAGDRVCPTDCSSKLTLDQTTLTLTCGSCGQLKELGQFCVPSCIGYYRTEKGCVSINGNENSYGLLSLGNCNKPIEEDGKCFRPDKTDQYSPTSKGYSGCTTAKYLQNFVCVSCTDMFITYNGYACQEKCGDNNFIYMPDKGLKMCIENMPKQPNLYAEITQRPSIGQYDSINYMQYYLTGVTCISPQNGKKALNGFCIASCLSYYTQTTNGCQDSDRSNGNCNALYAQGDFNDNNWVHSCIKECDANGFVIADSGEKLCVMANCIQNSFLIQTTSTVSCGYCGGVKQLTNKFCVRNCMDYYTNVKGCNKSNSKDGHCYKGFDQEDVCVPACDSSNLYYIQGDKCVTCMPTSMSQLLYIDHSGLKCMTSCQGNFIFSYTKVPKVRSYRVCEDGLVCPGIQTKKLKQNSLVCTDCSGFYVMQDTSFCVESCQAYYQRCTTKDFHGSCNKEYVNSEGNMCILGCTTTFKIISYDDQGNGHYYFPSDFLYSNIGEKICAVQECPWTSYNIIDQVAHKMTCSATCTKSVLQQLPESRIYCVDNCNDYNANPTGCNSLSSVNGACGFMYTDNNVCTYTKPACKFGTFYRPSKFDCSKCLDSGYFLAYNKIDSKWQCFSSTEKPLCLSSMLFFASSGVQVCADPDFACSLQLPYLQIKETKVDSEVDIEPVCEWCQTILGGALSDDMKTHSGRAICTISCKKYYDSDLCKNNRQFGNCNSEAVVSISGSKNLCIAADRCPDFRFSDQGDKICPNPNCYANEQTFLIMMTNLQTTCVISSISGLTRLGKFALHQLVSCKDYYYYANGCQTLVTANNKLTTAGNCNMPLYQNTICITPTRTDIADSNSGSFGPCPDANGVAYYLHNYICNVENMLTIQYIDYQGVHYLDSCGDNDYVIGERNQKYCKNTDCQGTQKLQITDISGTARKHLTCVDCVGSLKVLGSFCVASCQLYFTSFSAVACFDRKKGNCNLEYVETRATQTECVEKCATLDFFYTQNNRVCRLACPVDQYNNVDATTLRSTCGTCSGTKLGSSCLSSTSNTACINYNATCISTFDSSECKKVLKFNGACFAPTDKFFSPTSTSGYYISCPTGHYLLDYECIRCNQAGQYIDYSGNNCLTVCYFNTEMFTSNGQVICSADGPACPGQYDRYKIVEISADGMQNYKLVCTDCSKYNGKVLGPFCISSCKDYTKANYCKEKYFFGLCDRQFATTTIDNFYINCTTSCEYSWIYSDAGDKVCGIPDCPSGMYNTLTQSTLKMSCGTCDNKKMSIYCISSCFNYYTQITGCNGQYTYDGACNNPYDDSGTCMAYIPINKYLKDEMILSSCIGANEYVDYTGKKCVETCSNFIFSSTGLKVCKDGMPVCDSGNKIILNEEPIILTCDLCQAGNDLNGFCVPNCDIYNSQVTGCNQQAIISGNCGLRFAHLGFCIQKCPVDTYVRDMQCVKCDLISEFVDHSGQVCLSSCSVDFIWNSNGLKVCPVGLVCPKLYKISGTGLACEDSCSFKALNNFCVESCNGYFTATKGCKSVTSAAGSCNKNIEENSVCVSRCAIAKNYISNGVCGTCTAPNQFIHNAGVNCIASCTDFIYIQSGHKVCMDGLTCSGTDAYQVTDVYISQTVSLTVKMDCGPCNGMMLGPFCMFGDSSSCNSYFKQANGCNSSGASDGHCNVKLGQDDSCVAACSSNKWLQEDRLCIDCTDKYQFKDYETKTCIFNQCSVYQITLLTKPSCFSRAFPFADTTKMLEICGAGYTFIRQESDNSDTYTCQSSRKCVVTTNNIKILNAPISNLYTCTAGFTVPPGRMANVDTGTVFLTSPFPNLVPLKQTPTKVYIYTIVDDVYCKFFKVYEASAVQCYDYMKAENCQSSEILAQLNATHFKCTSKESVTDGAAFCSENKITGNTYPLTQDDGSVQCVAPTSNYLVLFVVLMCTVGPILIGSLLVLIVFRHHIKKQLNKIANMR